MPKRFGSPFDSFSQQCVEFCEQCGTTRGRNGVLMSVFEIASDRWSCAGASRWRRAWHSRWVGGTGRAPHRWVARQAVHQSLSSDRIAYRLQLACAVCGLQDEVTHVSAAAALASGVHLEPLARQSLGLSSAPPMAAPSARVAVNVNDGTGNVIYLNEPGKAVKKPSVVWPAVRRALWRPIMTAWRVIAWPARVTRWILTVDLFAPLKAVGRAARWLLEAPSDRIAFPMFVTTFALAIPATFGAMMYRDYCHAVEREQNCTQPRHAGVVEAVSPLVDSSKLLVRFVGGLEYRVEARAEDPILKPGLTGYVCENGHFHYQPAPPPTATLTLPAGEDF